MTPNNSLEVIVNLIPKLGTPKNLKNILPEETSALLNLLLTRGALQEACDVAFKSESDYLREQAASALFERYPIEALSLAFGTGNLSFLSEAGRKMVKIAPAQAYEAGKESHDDKLVENAKKELLKQPYDALSVAKKYRDYDLMSAAGRKLLNKEPWRAYEAAREAKDKQLWKDASTALLRSPRDAFEVGLQYKDKQLMYKAFDALVAHNPTEAASDALRSGDARLISKAGWAMLKQGHAFLAYDAGRKADNRKLVKAARAKFLEDPEYVYDRWFMHKDDTLATEALEKVAARDGLDPELVKKWYGPNGTGEHAPRRG